MLGRFHTIFSTFMCPGIILIEHLIKMFAIEITCRIFAYFYNYSYNLYWSINHKRSFGITKRQWNVLTFASIQDILNNCKDTHWNLVRESSGTLGNASNARAVMIAINQQEFIIRWGRLIVLINHLCEWATSFHETKH